MKLPTQRGRQSAGIPGLPRIPGLRRGRPLWMTILLFVVGFIVYAMQQKGNPAGPSSQQQSTNQQTSNHGGTAPEPPRATNQPRVANEDRKSLLRIPAPDSSPAPAPRRDGEPDDGGIQRLFRNQQSDTWVETEGVIKRVLGVDSSGDKHQRFIVRVASGIEILIAHNVTVAAQVPATVGDTIRFRGEYEYSEKGGVVHFTHKPKFKRRDPGGWIEFEGNRYE